jgi:hypothetical protein
MVQKVISHSFIIELQDQTKKSVIEKQLNVESATNGCLDEQVSLPMTHTKTNLKRIPQMLLILFPL